jgi:Recombination endonuclease VII
MTKKICIIKACGKPHKAKGYCVKHYRRYLEHGDPNIVKPPGSNKRWRRNPDTVLVGDEFGYWTVIGPYVRDGKENRAKFPCKCKCGTERLVDFRQLDGSKKTISCGCYQKEVMASKRKHGIPGTKKHQRSRWIWNTYKMTLEDYEELLNLQGDGCAICEEVPEYDLYVDHDHVTGFVRGLLCQDCNFGIANFKDNKEIMNEAIKYIERAEKISAEVKD